MWDTCIHIRYFKTPYGELILGGFGGRLCLCDWRFRSKRDSVDRRIQTGLQAGYTEGESDVTEAAILQLEAYFRQQSEIFDLPVLLVGTDFQKKVWSELMKIPYAHTETYYGLSVKLGNPLGIRAIAKANADNALAIIVPCHRVIGSGGKMTGYAGGIRVKRQLLTLEGCQIDTQQELF